MSNDITLSLSELREAANVAKKAYSLALCAYRAVADLKPSSPEPVDRELSLAETDEGKAGITELCFADFATDANIPVRKLWARGMTIAEIATAADKLGIDLHRTRIQKCVIEECDLSGVVFENGCRLDMSIESGEHKAIYAVTASGKPKADRPEERIDLAWSKLESGAYQLDMDSDILKTEAPLNVKTDEQAVEALIAAQTVRHMTVAGINSTIVDQYISKKGSRAGATAMRLLREKYVQQMKKNARLARQTPAAPPAQELQTA